MTNDLAPDRDQNAENRPQSPAARWLFRWRVLLGGLGGGLLHLAAAVVTAVHQGS